MAGYEVNHNQARYHVSIAVGILAGVLAFQGVASFFRNQNIDQNYVKPKNVAVVTVDRNNDGYKEVVLKFSTEDGKERTVDLTSENLEKLLQK